MGPYSVEALRLPALLRLNFLLSNTGKCVRKCAATHLCQIRCLVHGEVYLQLWPGSYPLCLSQPWRRQGHPRKACCCCCQTSPCSCLGTSKGLGQDSKNPFTQAVLRRWYLNVRIWLLTFEILPAGAQTLGLTFLKPHRLY